MRERDDVAATSYRAVIGVLVLALVAGCGRRDDGGIGPEPDHTVHEGMPVIFVAPSAPSEASPTTPEAVNPLAMRLKHDGTPLGTTAAGAPAAVLDPCAPRQPSGPLAMRLRHDGAGDGGARNPLCMRLK